MKSKVLALLMAARIAAGAAQAAEVYNKDGNKLDLYVKVDGLHYLSNNSRADRRQRQMCMRVKISAQNNLHLPG